MQPLVSEEHLVGRTSISTPLLSRHKNDLWALLVADKPGPGEILSVKSSGRKDLAGWLELIILGSEPLKNARRGAVGGGAVTGRLPFLRSASWRWGLVFGSSDPRQTLLQTQKPA